MARGAARGSPLRPTARRTGVRSIPDTTTGWSSCSPTTASTPSPTPEPTHAGPGGVPLLGGGEIAAQLHRFPNVVLWLNGHTHTNAVRVRRDPANPARAFWEVTTCAIADWPCQTRLVELIDAGGYLSIVCTMVDHGAPLAPQSLETGDDLASLHRELALNVPFGGPESALAGTCRRPERRAPHQAALPAEPPAWRNVRAIAGLPAQPDRGHHGDLQRGPLGHDPQGTQTPRQAPRWLALLYFGVVRACNRSATWRLTGLQPGVGDTGIEPVTSSV